MTKFVMFYFLSLSFIFSSTSFADGMNFKDPLLALESFISTEGLKPFETEPKEYDCTFKDVKYGDQLKSETESVLIFKSEQDENTFGFNYIDMRATIFFNVLPPEESDGEGFILGNKNEGVLTLIKIILRGFQYFQLSLGEGSIPLAFGECFEEGSVKI